jgi:hypothetical protein
MPFMSQTPVNYLTLIPQSGTPTPVPSGQLLLFLRGSDSALCTVDSSGLVLQVSTEVWGPISNGNPASPCICNARGAIVLSRRS